MSLELELTYILSISILYYTLLILDNTFVSLLNSSNIDFSHKNNEFYWFSI